MADEDDYRIAPKDAPEAKSYNDRADSSRADYDNDGTPNRVDPYDNDANRDPGDRDYDNDGRANSVDTWDNDWLKQ